ncbi:MAG: RluA family pseudouridine synthase [Proteobacteria bacterium]|nr:RluA family pseudouridine synthase [Pseudomonadota bacterium]
MSDRPKICTIAPEQAGSRLDVILSQCHSELSRSRLKALILQENVSQNGQTITDPAYRVKHGQTFATIVPDSEDMAVEPQAMDLIIRYEDEDLIVIDKTAGLVVHPGSGTPDQTLVNGLLAHCGDTLSGIGGVKRPGIVHRLDKDTSGLIVVAKNDETHIGLSTQFAERSVERAYNGLVWGTPQPPVGVIEGNIGRHPQNRIKMAVVPKGRGKYALTRYATLKRFGNSASLVECRLATGRTHQIRVHMAHKGHPLVGDPVYSRTTQARLAGFGADDAIALKACGRQVLHAVSLGFDHPKKGERLVFQSEFPADLKQVVEIFERVDTLG